MAEHEKDINRYSYSRLSTFKQCPRKHHYAYVEQIPQAENEHTICGKLFHRCVEQILKGEDCVDVYTEFQDLCRTGVLKLEPDLLQYIVDEYFNYYGKKYLMENTLMVESSIDAPIMGDDYLRVIIDQAFDDGHVVVRDLKTTLSALKYTHDDVKLNPQLLLYVPFVENEINRNVEAIEIDEVRLAKLKDVPLLKNGKPAVSKASLALVTYDDYYNALCEQGLEDDDEYQEVLEYLKHRGHPLFNRIRVQLLDRNVVDANNRDLKETYLMASQDPVYRVKGPLCMFCPYQDLCEQDMFNEDSSLRNRIKQNL